MAAFKISEEVILAPNTRIIHNLRLETKHRVGRSINSDWFVNGLVVVLYERILFYFGQNFVSKGRLIKTFSQTTIRKLFTNWSGLDVLPSQCNTVSSEVTFAYGPRDYVVPVVN